MMFGPHFFRLDACQAFYVGTRLSLRNEGRRLFLQLKKQFDKTSDPTSGTALRENLFYSLQQRFHYFLRAIRSVGSLRVQPVVIVCMSQKNIDITSFSGTHLLTSCTLL